MGHYKCLRLHPNFQIATPDEGETQIAFTLRCASLLLSPPQFPGEDVEIECTEAAMQMREIAVDVQHAWDTRRHGSGEDPP